MAKSREKKTPATPKPKKSDAPVKAVAAVPMAIQLVPQTPDAKPTAETTSTAKTSAKTVPTAIEGTSKEVKTKKKLFSFGKKKDAAKAPAAEAPTSTLQAAGRPVRKASGLKAFFIFINYIGMGKLRSGFIQNLATMLEAGLPLLDSLHTLSLEIRHKPMKKLVQRIHDSVDSGITLWQAMEQEYFFTPYEIALVRIGEEAGNLARNMAYLSVQQEKDHALRSKVKMVMIYPTIVLVLMFVIVMALGMFVLPNLIQVLFSLNAELPLSTKVVIWITKQFSAHGAVVAPSVAGGFIIFLLLGKYTNFRVVFQWMVFQIPGIGRLAREATIARFGVILGGLLQAGVPLVEAMHSLVEVTPIVSYKRFYKELLEHINIGDSFSKAFEALPMSRHLLPISVQQLIVTGEKSGALASILMKVSEIYEKKAEKTAEKLPTIFEPMLLLFMGGLVGGIAFSIIVPIYTVVGNVGR